MIGRRIAFMVLMALVVGGTQGSAQTSSLGAKKRQVDAGKVPPRTPREIPQVETNSIYQRYSWITVQPSPPKKFQVGDLITIIVREQRQFKVNADLETKKAFDITTDLGAFLKPITGGLGSTDFRRGKPNIDFRFDTELKNEGDSTRKDRMTLRLSGNIIDVKPNGLLVIEAKARVQHDEEITEILLTGTCRKEDVTADNTVLSTQIADKNLVVNNEGAVRDSTTRGWIPKLLDLIRLF